MPFALIWDKPFPVPVSFTQVECDATISYFPRLPSVTRHAFGPTSPTWASHVRSKIRGLGVPHGSHASQPTEPAGGGEGAETRRNGDETRRDAKRCEKGADKGGIWVVLGSFFPFGRFCVLRGFRGWVFRSFPCTPISHFGTWLRDWCPRGRNGLEGPTQFDTFSLPPRMKPSPLRNDG